MPRSAALALAALYLAPHAAARPPAAVGEPCYLEVAKLVASDGAPNDFFGLAVALSGDTLLVGAPSRDETGTNSGVAYVFVRAGGSWSQQAKLLPADSEGFHYFGAAVDLGGDTAVVGAASDDEGGNGAGAVYVFVRAGAAWTQQAKLLASDAASGDGFGSSLDLDGDRISIGAPGDDDHGSFSGSAYVFAREGASWTQEAKLLANDGAVEDGFGEAVALSGDLLAVGAPGDDDLGTFSGSVYVYARGAGGWSQQTKLVASDGTSGDRFGSSLAMHGGTLLGGALNADGGSPSSGAVYAFVRSGASWVEQAKLFPHDVGSTDQFGNSLALDGSTALVGAVYHDGVGTRSGAVYAFVRAGGSWTEHVQLSGSDVGAFSELGIAVALEGATAVAASIRDDDNGQDAGAAYVFDLPPRPGVVFCTCHAGPCGNSDDGAGCANSTGSGALLTAAGPTLPDEVNLFATGVPAGQLGVFSFSTTTLTVPFGDGIRCIGGGPALLTGIPRKASQDGSIGFGLCFGDAPLSSVTGVVPGSGTIERYQLLYRDPGGPCSSNFNLSNGFEVVW